MNARAMKVIKDMEKKFGTNVLRKASDIVASSTGRVPTGSVGLDVAIGGGYPIGRFIHLAGGFSSTKSTTSYHAIREFQKYFKENNIDRYCLLIQGEQGSYTDEYGRSIGIDTDLLIINESASMEESLELARQLQEQEVAGLIVIDSLASLIPMKEQDKTMDDTMQMGIKPKLFDEYFRKFQALNNKLSREGKFETTVIGINQIREKIGGYGNPEYSPGGRSIGHTSSLTLKLRKGEPITLGTGVNKKIIGQQVVFKVDKSKVSIPYISGSWDVYLDEGGPVPKGHIDTFKEVIIESIMSGVVNKSGAWLDYKDVKAQGADNFTDILRNDLELYEEIKQETMRRATTDIEELVELGKIEEDDKEGAIKEVKKQEEELEKKKKKKGSKLKIGKK